MPRYRIEPGVVFELVDGEAVVLSLESSTYYKLNPVGARIWRLLQDEPTHEQLLQTLESEYEVTSGRVREDVHHLLAELQRAALVSPIPELDAENVD